MRIEFAEFAAHVARVQEFLEGGAARRHATVESIERDIARTTILANEVAEKCARWGTVAQFFTGATFVLSATACVVALANRCESMLLLILPVAAVAVAALREATECAAWAERAKSAHVLVAWLREARDEAVRRERDVRPKRLTTEAWEHGRPIHDPAGNVVYVWDSLRGAVVGGAPTGSLVPPDKLTPLGREPKG